MDSTRPGSSHSQYSKNRRAPEQPCLQALLRFRMETESISLHHFILKPTEPTIGSYVMMETRTTIPPPHPAELRHRRCLFIRLTLNSPQTHHRLSRLFCLWPEPESRCLPVQC